MSARDVIEILAIVLAAGLVSEVVAGLLRLPRMVVLLAAGVVLGPEALDAIEVPLDSIGVELLLTFGVSIILFYGGLGVAFAILSRTGIGLTLLAVPGVVLTALVVGAVASAAFDVSFVTGFLVGAVLAPTDPAILVPLFERLRIRPKVSQTLIAESAFNDATGSVLALSIAAFVLEGEGNLTAPLAEFVEELAVSIALGVVFGLVLAVVIARRRIGIWRESPVVALAALIAVAYVAIDSAGGSGYMGAFIAGVIAGNAESLRLGRAEHHERELSLFAERITDIVVLFVFILVGANLPFDAMADNAAPALATLASLLFLARPLTVAASLLPDRRGRWTREELAFVTWTRETGVVPVALVGILVAEGVPYEDELLTLVAFAIVVTLGLQATTKGWLARRLGLAETPAEATLFAAR